MATTPTSIRFSEDLIDQLEAKAEELGVTRNELVIRYVEHGLKTYGLKTLALSTSEIACLDQLAAMKGCTRIELMKAWVGQRLRREFVARRQGVVVEIPG